MTRCGSCNAAFAPEALRCDYCGAATGVADPSAAAPEPADPLAGLMQEIRDGRVRPPLAALYVAPPVVEYLVFAIFIVLPLVLMAYVTATFGVQPVFILLPTAFVLLAASLLYVAHRRYVRRRDAAPQPHPARVVAKRTEISHSQNSSRTTYRITLEFLRGRRIEYEVDGSVYGHVAEGDIGLAWFRAEWLHAFSRRMA